MGPPTDWKPRTLDLVQDLVHTPIVTTVNVHQAKTQLSKLLERVMSGEQIIIARAGRPVAVLSPIEQPALRRRAGNDAGKVTIAPDFDEPLPEFDV